jgi:hypothetical protein
MDDKKLNNASFDVKQRLSGERLKYLLRIASYAPLSLFAAANPQDALRDIKPLIDIPDMSFYIYWGLISAAVLLMAGVLFFVLKRLWENRKRNMAKYYLEQLKAIDWRDAKASAYAATKYGRLLATDDRRKELFEQLLPLLEKYKYKKEVEAADEETRRRFNLYVQVVDESI